MAKPVIVATTAAIVCEFISIHALRRGDFNPPLAEALLAGWRKYFATRLDRLPYFGKSRAFAPGAFYFSAYLFWI